MLCEKSSSLLSTLLRHVPSANLERYLSVHTEGFLCNNTSVLRMLRTESRSLTASYLTTPQKPAGKR